MEKRATLNYTNNKTCNDDILHDSVLTLDDEFIIAMGGVDVPEIKALSGSRLGVLGLCLQGSAIIDIYTQQYKLTKGDLMLIMPEQTGVLKGKSDDFKIDCFIVSRKQLNEALVGISRLSPLFYIHMRRKSHYRLTDDERSRFTQYFKLAHSWMKLTSNMLKREYIITILRLFYVDLYYNYQNSISAIEQGSETRKEKLTYDFFLLITDYYRQNREVAFYAQKLFITPKYLSSVIKEISGRSAKDWIVEYIILDIKSLLKNPSLNIQEIAIKTNFSNQAALGRFFKKHTGLSPSQYRNEL